MATPQRRLRTSSTASASPATGETEAGAQPGDRRGDRAGAASRAPRTSTARCGGARAPSRAGRRRRRRQRAQALLALADLIEEHGEELAREEAINAGKPIAAVDERRDPA